MRHQESLTALEGQQVEVTVVPVAPASVNGDDEPPEDMDVEKDVYFKMPFRHVETIPSELIVDGGPLRPTLIFPEELPDE